MIITFSFFFPPITNEQLLFMKPNKIPHVSFPHSTMAVSTNGRRELAPRLPNSLPRRKERRNKGSGGKGGNEWNNISIELEGGIFITT